MQNKIIKTDKSLHKEMMVGVKLLMDTVTCTMGANGSAVIIEPEDGQGYHKFTKDGVSVADSIKFENGFQNMGVSAIIDSAVSTVKKVGDGTSTTTLFSSMLYMSAFRTGRFFKGARKKSISEFNKKIDKEKEHCLELLSNLRMTKKYAGLYEAIATLSANNDKKIGKLVAEIYDKIGDQSIVRIVPSEDSPSISYTIEDGFSVNSGYIHKFFARNSHEISILEIPAIITNHELKSLSEIKSLVNNANMEKLMMVVFARNFSEEFISSCVETLNVKGLNIFPILLPKDDGIIEDISAIIGCKIIDTAEHPIVSDISDLKFIGRIEEAIIDANKTIIKKIPTKNLVDQNEVLKSLKEKLETKTAKERLGRRIAKLNGKVATIHVGGDTGSEIQYMCDVLDDSTKATQKCLENGYVLGCGVTYLQLADSLRMTFKDSLLADVLESSIKKLMQNSEIKGGFKKASKMIREKEYHYGLDLFSSEISMVNLKENGIVEPYDLPLACIENSVSVAKLLVSSRAGIAISENK